jgi:toxin ParE1/3/4
VAQGKPKPLTTHQQDESLNPRNRPSEICADRTTVLDRKGTLRRALALSAPFCQDGFATGGSGGMSSEAFSTTEHPRQNRAANRLHRFAHTAQATSMARYRISRKAVQDLDDLWYFIAKDNETAASGQLERLHAAFKTLASQPHMGRVRPEIAPRMRSFAVGEHVVFYEAAGPGVRIIRVWDGRRDLARM